MGFPNWYTFASVTPGDIGLGTGDSPTFTDLILSGDLSIFGTTVTVDAETVLRRSNYDFLNVDYTAAVAVTAGHVINYLPTATADTVAGAYTPGVDGVSDPTVVTTGSGTFSSGDIIQISGSTDNDGFYEVHDHTGTTLTLRSTANGVTDQVEDWSLNQPIAGNNDGAITKVGVAILRVSAGGNIETGFGNTVPITYTAVGDFQADGSVTLSSLLMSERADHENTPAAGKAEYWVGDAVGSPAMFTSDSGEDKILAAPTRHAIAASDIDAKAGNTQTKTVSGPVTFTASNFGIGDEVLLELAVSASPAEPTWPATTTKLGTTAWDPAQTNFVVFRCTNTTGPTFIRVITHVTA